ncbi:cytochrome c [Chroococcus sp. FPU101]|uniref:c-type cytochrome n=1 Tax=Chroococcus sp. FPU101 TaxID=1974212 RepID=UPI001F5D5E41|nr:cytochrome c [Chroococcus sp. FPU101]
MDSQLTGSKVALHRLLIGVMAALLIIFTITIGLYFHQISDPYIREVLSLSGDLKRGSEIFQINCAVCHGIKADGSVGPSLHHVSKRKSRVSLINQVISGKTPPMPKFQPTSQDMSDLLSYLERL